MTTAEAAPIRNVGHAHLRKEDARLVTGHATWTDNIQVPGVLHMAMVRSPVAHARITNVDLSAAKEQPGVVAAFSGADLAGAWQASLPSVWAVTPDVKEPPHWPLAQDKVRYVGDGVAVVVATSRAAAVDAADYVDVEYDSLPAVTDVEEALRGEVLVHEDAGTNRCYQYHWDSGNVDDVFSKADVVVRRRYINQRLIPNAIEPRAVVVQLDPGTGGYSVYSATQIPHILRVQLAIITGVPEHKLRVVAPDVGGGFGSKLNVYAEEPLALVLAQRLGKPIKWTETRSENYQATIHGRDHVQDLEIAATRDGRILGYKADITADLGGYLQLVTTGTPILGAFMYPGIYKMDAHALTITGVFTTKTPTDAYRGAGRPEATYAIERLVDDLAAELGMDPIELRRKNWITHDEFPYDTLTGLTYDSGNYEAATDLALQHFGYDELRREQDERRRRGDAVQLGIGVSTYTEMCGLAPSRLLGALNYRAGGWEHATVRMLPTGVVQVITGTSPHGQGHVTAWSQIAADALGVGYDDVEVLHGDTAVSHKGMDTYGSRSLAVGGYAVQAACEKVVEKARRMAAHMLEANVDDIEFDNGKFSVRGSPDTSTTIQQMALAAFAAHSYPEGDEPGLDSEATIDPSNFSFPHGTHLCAVEVDTETGRVNIRRYVAVDDVGKVVNPQIVEGQVHGGIAQGVAQALFEEAVYDADGNLVTGSLVDYHVPAAPDLPDFRTDRTETPATSHPLGVKGVGEAGTIASTPAVINAVVDALRPMGVQDVRMPASPQHVWDAIQDASKGGAA
ncbi:MAG: xanthine dehydrogenase family protein molybdopterin-binding subunit [bacterium]